MRPGREMDCAIAQNVFGHRVYIKRRVPHEETPKGERPLRPYSKEMEWAWEVASKMGISLIPIENGAWFALVGNREGWKSPAAFIAYLQTGEFAKAGAAVGEDAPRVICTAALNAIESRKSSAPMALN